MTLIAVFLAFACLQGDGGGDPWAAPALNARRYPEDYRGLRDREGAPPWWARFKDRELGGWDVSFGLELRGQMENFRGDGLREGEDDGLDYVWWRALPTFEARRGPWRVFTQLIFAVASGLDEEPSPIDEDRGDFLQGFGEYEVQAGSGAVGLRVGRQLLAFGSQRLVGFRYGPNVPLAFDAVLATGRTEGFEATALWGRPVAVEAGSFDDEPRSDEWLYGLYTTTSWNSAALDAYYLGHRARSTRYDQGTGEEDRHTAGLRWSGERGIFDWNAEIFGQLGRFNGAEIRAWSATVESGWRLDHEPTAPRLFGRASIISGDNDPDDDALGTFDPLFPRGKYFGEIGTIGPYNLIDVLAGIEVEITEKWLIEASSTAYWRESTGDGVYANNGALLRSGRGSSERFVGYQGDIAVTRRISRGLSWTVGYSLFIGGDFIEATGPSEDLHFFQLSGRLLF